jgi:hypothetical protein
MSERRPVRQDPYRPGVHAELVTPALIPPVGFVQRCECGDDVVLTRHAIEARCRCARWYGGRVCGTCSAASTVVLRNAPSRWQRQRWQCWACGASAKFRVGDPGAATGADITATNELVGLSSDRSVAQLILVAGWGWVRPERQLVVVTARNDALLVAPLCPPKGFWRIPWTEVTSLSFFGPGRVTTDAGAWGVGTGWADAARIAVEAEVINWLTRTTTVTTFVRLTGADGELVFYWDGGDLAEARTAFAPVVGRLEIQQRRHDGRAQPTGPALVDGLERLAALHRQGALTDDEYAAAKTELLR